MDSVTATDERSSIREMTGLPVLPAERPERTETAPSLLSHGGPEAGSRESAVVCNPESHPSVIRGYSHGAESSSRWWVVPRH